MSRGRGRIERAVEAVFDTERDNAFTLEDLAGRIYPGANRIDNKHRVSIARAARNLGRGRPEIQCMKGEGLGGALVFFRCDEVMSYAMARMKADRFYGYRSNDDRRHPANNRDEADLRRTLGDDRHRKHVEPGGAWWNWVHIFLALRDGNHGEVARLEAENRARLEAIFAELNTVRLR